MNYKTNIPLFYLFRILGQLEFTIAIYAVFLLANGLSITQVMILEMWFLVTTLLLEIPSGVFADFYGRKTTLIISELCAATGFVVFGLAHSFSHFLIANMLVGTTVALFSGADRAFVYDSLKQIKKAKSYAKIMGRIGAIQTLGWGSMALISGTLATWLGYRPLFFMTAATFTLSAIIGCFLKEPPLQTKHTNYAQHLKEAVQFSWTHKKVKIRLLYFAVLGACTHMAWLLLQVHYLDPNILKYAIALYFFCFGLGSFLAHKVPLKKEGLLAGIAISVTAAAFIVIAWGSPYCGIAATGIFSFFAGAAYLLLDQKINNVTSSHRRATVSSVVNMAKSAVYASIAIIMGIIADMFSSATVFMTLAIFLILSSLYIMPRYLKE